MRHVPALPLKAVGFGRDRVAARVCLEATEAALRSLPDYRRLCDLLQRELELDDLEGPALRFLQSLVDEMTEANLMAMGLDETDMVSVSIDVERMASEARHFEIGTVTPYGITVSHSPDDDAGSAAATDNRGPFPSAISTA